jgi:hypothetical protein
MQKAMKLRRDAFASRTASQAAHKYYNEIIVKNSIVFRKDRDQMALP